MANHLKQNQKEAYKALRRAGLTDQAAKIVTANFSGESLAQPWRRGWDIKQFSQGIAQWSQIRADRIKAHFGKFPREMTVTEQVNAFIWECQKYYKKTWRALTTPDNEITPAEQMLVLVHDFERPRNPTRDIKTRLKIYAALDKLGEAYGAVDGTKPKPS